MDLGEFNLGQVIDFSFTTRARSATPVTFLGSPALACMKSNSSVQSTAGITLTVNYGGTTGLNHVHIDTSADPVFYSSRTEFDVVVTSGTVDSITVVGEVLAHFNILDWAFAIVPTTPTTVTPPLSANQSIAIWEQRILLEVGADADGADDLDPISWQIDSIWNDWAAKGVTGAYLQYLYTKRQCLQILAGQIRSQSIGSTLGPITTKGQDKFKNVMLLIDQCTKQIVEEEKRQQMSRTGFVGPITENGQLPVVPAYVPQVQPQDNSVMQPGSKLWRF